MLGPNHPDVATSLNNLSSLYYVQGRYDAAEPLYLRALTFQERAMGPDNPDVAAIRKNYSAFLRAIGRSKIDVLRTPPTPIRILLADSHPIVRQGMRAVLEQAGMAVIGEASDGQETLRIAQEQHPDVAVLDIGMPHLNGLETARRLHEALPQTKIVFLTVHTGDLYVLEAMQAVAVGYVLETQAVADLVQAIRDVSQGEIYLSPQISRTVVTAYLTRSDLPRDPLTSREREILQLIAEGQTTREIAWRLGLRVKTVESHRTKLMQKLDIHETATLVRYAIRRGLTRP